MFNLHHAETWTAYLFVVCLSRAPKLSSHLCTLMHFAAYCNSTIFSLPLLPCLYHFPLQLDIVLPSSRLFLVLQEVSGRIIRVEFAKRFRKPSPTPAPITPSQETHHKLYVSNLAWKVRGTHLREFFSVTSKPVSSRVVFESPAGRSAGYGFVSFATREEAEAALMYLNGKVSCIVVPKFINSFPLVFAGCLTLLSIENWRLVLQLFIHFSVL